MYKIIGSVGVVAGILTMLLIKEPKRGVYDLRASKKADGDDDLE